MKNHLKEEWEDLSDSPEEFATAIKNANSANERTFFEKLRFKILHETAASNDVLLNESDNEEGIYILRVGTDDFLIGKDLSKPEEKSVPEEFAGIFLALEQDMYRYLGRHITLWEWLRERDYNGIRYDANNDYN